MGNQDGYKILHPDWVRNIMINHEIAFSTVGTNFNNCVEIYCTKEQFEIYTTVSGAEAKSISGSVTIPVL